MQVISTSTLSYCTCLGRLRRDLEALRTQLSCGTFRGEHERLQAQGGPETTMGNIFKGSCTQYIHDYSIQFLHSAAGKCRPNTFKFNAAVTSFFLLTQVLLSDTNLVSETLSGVKRVPFYRKSSC